MPSHGRRRSEPRTVLTPKLVAQTHARTAYRMTLKRESKSAGKERGILLNAEKISGTP